MDNNGPEPELFKALREQLRPEVAILESLMDCVESTLNYFMSMLLRSLQEISLLTGRDLDSIRKEFEKELDLESAVEKTLMTLRASKDLLP